jgi:hypothetical protein
MSITAAELIFYAAKNSAGAAAGPVADDVSVTGGDVDLTRRPVFTQMAANSTIRVVSDGADTRVVTVTGRLASGALDTEALTLNGATPVTGAKTFERIEKVEAASTDAARTVTVTNSGNTVTFGTIPVNEIGFFMMFENSSSDPSVTKTRQEVIYAKNTDPTLALTSATVTLTADASGKLTIALGSAKGSLGATQANRLAAQTGISGFSGVGSAISVPTNQLAAGEYIAIVVKQSLAINDAAQKNTFNLQLQGQST